MPHKMKPTSERTRSSPALRSGRTTGHGLKSPTVPPAFTLKMEVPHRDHPHLIGRGGKRVNDVMAATNCRIHFPDENVSDLSGQKSNAVDVSANSLDDLERARASLRDAMPINIGLKLNGGLKWTLTDSQQIGSRFSVDIRRIDDVVWVKASGSNVRNLEAAIEAVATALKTRPSLEGMQFPVSKDALPLVRGGACLNLKRIADSAGIALESSAKQDGLILNGQILRCITAYKMIIGSLPLELSFRVRSSCMPTAAVLEKLSKAHDCMLRFEQGGTLAILTSYERNAGNLYKACGALLGLPVNFKCAIPEDYHAPPDAVYKFRHTYEIVTFRNETRSAIGAIERQPSDGEKPSVIKIDLGCTIVSPSVKLQPLVAATEDPLLVLLRENNLEATYPRFQLHQVDVEVFRTMSETDFARVGVQAFGLRRRLSLLVEQMNRPPF